MRFEEHYYTENEMTIEMKNHFEKRTNNHIGLVQKYCGKVNELGGYDGIVERGEIHDASKFEEPEYTPYVFITWDYKCKDDGVDSEFPQEIKNKATEATNHHVKSNRHHPEFHTEQTDLINREDRDKPPEEMVDAMEMDNLDIAEMVCDWCAMSEERGNTPMQWADKNVNVRWKFTDEQKDLIYDLMNKIWEE